MQAGSYTPLKVLLDARKLGQGGIGEYIRNLIEGLLEFNASCASTVVSLSVVADRRVVREYDWAGLVEVLHDETPCYSLSEYLGLARRIPLHRFDLFHEPHFTLPFGITIPSIVTIHDLIHIRYPERWYYPLVAKSLVRSAIARADRVTTVSRATATDLLQFLGQDTVAARKISIVPNALSRRFSALRADAERAREKFEIRSPFFFSLLSQDKPHKGGADLRRAFAMVKALAPEMQLIVAGQGTAARVEEHGVRSLGTIREEDLVDLYAACTALVVPSLAEGFCIPALQAKAKGALVVARPIDPLFELLDESDIICRDLTVEALAEGMRLATHATRPSSHATSKFCAQHALLQTVPELLGLYMETSRRILPSLAALAHRPRLVANFESVKG